MENRNYKAVDVLARVLLLGNPVAVVLDAVGLDTTEMQRIAVRYGDQGHVVVGGACVTSVEGTVRC